MRLEIVPQEKEKRRRMPIVGAAALLLTGVMLLLTAACIWAVGSFENISLEECLFYLSMPLRGTSKQFTREMLTRVFLPAGAAFALVLAAVLLPRRKAVRAVTKKGRAVQLLPLRVRMRFAFPLLILWLAVVLPFGDRLLGIRTFIGSRIHQSRLIEERYVDPAKTKITFPEKKRNLITIYVESAESTNQDTANGGLMDHNYIPEMTALARENVSFSQNGLIAGAAVAPACGWTVAGMIAQTAGLPLKLYKYDNLTADNMGRDFISFLPGATMLGDILQKEGYRNVFICGSDFDFGGRRQLYLQHGGYEIHDYFTAVQDGKIPADYYYGWGFEDQKLYAYTKELLLELAAGDQPFHLGVLTVDTHNPGWLCDLCPQTDGNIYGRVVSCSSRQVGEFIDWCRGQDFFRDTAIVITGDHASMTLSFYEEHAAVYDRYNGSEDRLVYNAFINASPAPVREKNRKFTTMDFFPTVLSAMGARIEGERLGLGTNLFSDVPTLSEELGYDALFDELRRKSAFYDSRLLRQ